MRGERVSPWSRVKSHIREFLESSTIHGLGHISTSSKIWIKIIWTIIIILGFSTAGLLISNAFKSWAESPVMSTIETFPIEDLKFPEVTICPPFGTNTALNYDIIKARNSTLTVDERNELIEDVHVARVEECGKEVTEMVTEEDVKRFFEGTARLYYPTKNLHKIDIVGLNGTVKSPRFGLPYKKLRYKRELDYNWTFILQDNWPKNAKFVMEIQLDTSVFGNGQDHIEIEVDGQIIFKTKRGQRNYTGVLKHGKQIMKRKRERMRDLIEINYKKNLTKEIRIRYIRRMSAYWNHEEKLQRETGYKMFWWIKGIDKDDIAPIYNVTEENMLFKKWMTDIYLPTLGNDQSKERLMEEVIKFVSKDGEGKKKNVMEKMKQFIELLKYKDTTKKVLNEENKDINWLEAFEIFMMVSCPSGIEKKEIVMKPIRFYKSLLKIAPLYKIIHILSALVTGNNEINFASETPWYQDVMTIAAKRVYRRLKPKLNFKLGRMDLALSTKSDLKRRLYQPHLTDIKKMFQNCMDNGNCDDIQNILESLKKSQQMMESSTHPVHIVNGDGQINPSSFIPFCQFNGRSFGTKINLFSQAVCTGFETVFIKGRKCYSLNIKKFWNDEIKFGREYGLKLLLDYNRELSVGNKYKPKKKERKNKATPIRENNHGNNFFSEVKFYEPYNTMFDINDINSHKSAKCKLYIHNIEPYTSYGGGKYIMTSMKKLKTTEAFHNLTLEHKKCVTEEEGKNCLRNESKKIYESGITICGCLPIWIDFIPGHNKSLGQGISVYTPAGNECYQEYLASNQSTESSCLKPCEGLYSDVLHMDYDDKITVMESNFTTMLEEYAIYKGGYVNYTEYQKHLIGPGWFFKNDFTKLNESGYNHLQLEVLEIYIDTPTYDQITLDVKTNMETMISTIGGTLGLFTGFSLMSGFEIVFFLTKIIHGFCQSLITKKKSTCGHNY